MKYALINHIAIIVLMLAISACGQKQVTVEGESFISTRGGDNIKLGGMEIVFFDGSKINFEELSQSYTNVFQPAQDALNVFLGKEENSNGVEKTIENSEDPTEKTDNEANFDTDKVIKIADNIAYKEIKEASKTWDVPDWVNEVINERIKNSEELARQHNDLLDAVREACSYQNQLSLIYGKIKDFEIGRSRTNADGELSINLPEKDSYVVLAENERIVSSEENKEKYVWIVRVQNDNPNGTQALKFQLSNFNLSSMEDDKEPDESTGDRLILKSPNVQSVATFTALIRKGVLANQIAEWLKN